MEKGLHISKRNLPHWRLEGSTYLVTWRLKRYQRFLVKAEKDLISESLIHFHNDRYALYCYAVMDNHVHGIVKPDPKFELSNIIQTWKSFTAHQMVKQHGRQAPIWLDEYMDRIIRSESDLLEKANYILTNPQRKWGLDCEYEWTGLAGQDY